MKNLLIIHTAFQSAFVAITTDDKIVAIRSNDQPKEHGSFLHATIDELLKENDLSPKDIAAVGVTTGPGSYTGIRVGLAAAKGLCFALDIPLIGCNTLESLAKTVIDEMNENAIYIPMINARKNEFYTAAYNKDLKELAYPSLKIMSEDIYTEFSGKKYIFGAGSHAVKELICGQDVNYPDLQDINPKSLVSLVWKRYISNRFITVDDAAPLYLKEAYTTTSKSNF